MSAPRSLGWALWGAVSSGFREIEIGWDRLESVGLVAPFVAPAPYAPERMKQSMRCALPQSLSYMKRQEKQCPKCRRQQPIDMFMLAAGRPPSLFCQGCRETEKTCRRCGKSKSIIEFSSSEGDRIGFCKSCYANARSSIYARGRARADAIWHKRYGTERPVGTSHYDQDPAEVLLAPKRRRAERLGKAKRKPIDREAVFERDGWLCGICGDPVETGDESLDHIVPISRGGADQPSNVRLAHSLCNSRRGDGIRHPGARHA